MLEKLIEKIKQQVALTGKLPVDFKQKWIQKLRSGKYKQGRGKLFIEEEDSYCCLGLAALCYNIDLKASMYRGALGCIPNHDPDQPQFEIVPKELRENYDLQKYLYQLNDTAQLPFDQIADIIEEHL